MKKVYAWLSDEERGALARYCEREGKSMYAVLKEAVVRIIQGESSIAPKQDSGLVAPSVETVQVVSPKLEERVSRLEKEFEKITDHDKLWEKIAEQNAGMGELRGLVSGLLLKLTKTEELEAKLDSKNVDTVVKVLKNLGFGGIKQGV